MNESTPGAEHDPPAAETDVSTPIHDTSGEAPAEGQPTRSAEPGPDPEVEIVDALPVVAEMRTIERASPASLPAVQVVAVAATGFVAGAATVVLARRRSARKLGRNGRGGPRRPVDMLPIAASRSFLVDVHVIAKPE